jgi:transposase
MILCYAMTMKAYSVDLRTRVLDALDSGMPRAKAVELFQVSSGSIKRWLRLRHINGDITPQHPSGRIRIITPDQEARLRAQILAAPDASLAEHAAQWTADYGSALSSWTIARALRRIGWSRKKRR